MLSNLLPVILVALVVLSVFFWRTGSVSCALRFVVNVVYAVLSCATCTPAVHVCSGNSCRASHAGPHTACRRSGWQRRPDEEHPDMISCPVQLPVPLNQQARPDR